MTEYISFDPDVDVSGRVLLSWIEGTNGAIIPVLEAYGICDVTPDKWFSLQLALDALREFGQTSDLVSMGKKIIDTAKFPLEQMTCIQSALQSIDQAYHMNHRNGEIGNYIAEVVDTRHIKIIAENPYPSDFDYGLLWAVAHRFQPDDGDMIVELDTTQPTRPRGADSCTYHITW